MICGENFKKNYEYIGMVDGAFIHKNKAGSGGGLKNAEGNLQFIFFGPAKVNNNYEAEWEAAKFMFPSLLESKRSWQNICICSDSREVKQQKSWQELDLSGMSRDLLGAMNFKYMGREYNSEANGLAKAGLFKTYIIKGWI